jgi:hypothetical protein
MNGLYLTFPPKHLDKLSSSNTQKLAGLGSVILSYLPLVDFNVYI